MAEARDGCVVPTEPLAHMVVGFVSQWKDQHPSTSGRFARGGRRQTRSVGPLEWLSTETGVPRRTIANLTARNKNGRLGRNDTTELRIADALVSAIGHPEAFHDGTLPLMVNRNADLGAKDECRRCGGRDRLSLNGSHDL